MMAGMRVEISNYSLRSLTSNNSQLKNAFGCEYAEEICGVLREPPTAPGSVREPYRLEIEKREL